MLDDDNTPIAPGSSLVGRLARRGDIPLGYFNDPDKTARTFVEAGGHRWVLPGDLARVEDDGSITLLGRGSSSINTGGEKVFPEEVEAALKADPQVADAVVVGVPDERWGQRVVAVIQAAGQPPTVDELRAHGRGALAGYKLPREVVVVDEIRRSAAGKADLGWVSRRRWPRPTGTDDVCRTARSDAEHPHG